MENIIREIFAKITERYSTAIRIGSRCEASAYYRIEDISDEDMTTCAEYIAERIYKVCYPAVPEILIELDGSFTGLASQLARSLAAPGEQLQVVPFSQLSSGNGSSSMIKHKQVMLVNDVITTARTCLEAHTRATMLGASVLCWAALVDRTFGPGPVPVIAAFTGEPVILLEEIP